jgi:hypothetical protein
MIYIVIYSVLLIVCLLVLWGSLKNGGSKSATIVAYSFSVWMIFCIIFYVHKYVTKTEIFSVTTTSAEYFDGKVLTAAEHDKVYAANSCTCRLIRSGCYHWQQICGRPWEWSVQFLMSLSPMYAHKSDDERCKWKKYYFSTGLSTLSWYGRFKNCWGWDSGAFAPQLEKE